MAPRSVAPQHRRYNLQDPADLNEVRGWVGEVLNTSASGVELESTGWAQVLVHLDDVANLAEIQGLDVLDIEGV